LRSPTKWGASDMRRILVIGMMLGMIAGQASADTAACTEITRLANEMGDSFVRMSEAIQNTPMREILMKLTREEIDLLSARTPALYDLIEKSSATVLYAKTEICN